MYSKSILLGLVVLGSSACTNNVTQHTYSQSTAQVAPATVATAHPVMVPTQVAVPMHPPTLKLRHESGTMAGGSYFYRRYQ